MPPFVLPVLLVVGTVAGIWYLLQGTAGAAQMPPGPMSPTPMAGSELYPTPQDVVTVLIQRQNAEQLAAAFAQPLTDEIVSAFAAKGYRVAPLDVIANGAAPTGAANSIFRRFQVVSGAAAIALPRALGPGLTIVDSRRPGPGGVMSMPMPMSPQQAAAMRFI